MILIGKIWDRFILLGIMPDDSTMDQAYSDLLLVVWKFVLIHFTLVDLRNQSFQADQVWKGALIRYLSKANKLSFVVRLKQVRSEARGDTLSTNAEERLLAPLGSIDASGQITWRDDFQLLIDADQCQPCRPG